MPFCRQLSESFGNGIINPRQMAMRRGDAALFIGLGGMGTDTLKLLKQEIHRRVRPDNSSELNTGSAPKYENIRYLAIDHGSYELTTQGAPWDISRETEFFDLSVLTPDGAHGTGGIRRTGRAYLIEKAAQLRTKLLHAISEVTAGFTGRLQVYIFSGLSGGTGGGIFIDVCYIVQEVLFSMGKWDTLVRGYFFLPDVKLSEWPAANPGRTVWMKANGYAALKELDYMMGLEMTGGRFRQEYSGFYIDTASPPVHACYLISAVNADSCPIMDGCKYGISLAAEHAITSLLEAVPPEPELLLVHPPVPVHPPLNLQLGPYTVIGASSAIVPLSDINGYLAAGLFETFCDRLCQVPGEEDLKRFTERAQMTFEGLEHELHGRIVYKIPYPDDLLKAHDIIPGDERVIQCAENWLHTVREQLQKNSRRMLKTPENYDFSNLFASLLDPSAPVIFRILRCLYQDSAEDPSKGLVFAERLLEGSDNKSLRHVIAAYIAQNKERNQCELSYEDQIRKELDSAEQLLGNAGIFHRYKRRGDYFTALSRWYYHLAKLEYHNHMERLLEELRYQLDRLSSEFFQRRLDILDTLQTCFHENYSYLSRGCRPAPVCGWNVLNLPDIKDELDRAVSDLDTDQVFNRLMREMFTQPSREVYSNESQMTSLISEFVLSVFMPFSQRTLRDYLQLSYRTEEDDLLGNKIREDIISRMFAYGAVPAFPFRPEVNYHLFPQSTKVIVPTDLADSVETAMRNAALAAVSVHKTYMNDRISMFRLITDVPLSAYRGLEDLERAYRQCGSDGRKLFEIQ